MPLSFLLPWKKAPFIRLLVAVMTGIIIQWQLQIPVTILWYLLIIPIIIITCFFYISYFSRYKLTWINGIAVFMLFLLFGALLSFYKDARHNDKWFGNFYKENNALIVTLDEPLVEKTKSIKANAKVAWLIRDGVKLPVNGTVILYFKKELPGEADNSLSHLKYGSQIIFKKSLQEIKNSGNPGGFDYKRYSLFHGITHQVYLKPYEFEILDTKKENFFNSFLFKVRESVLRILRKNIKGEKEAGLAEALLIGYKDDLDQSLVQSYTNTGVVHIIAISGLHLGLIYWLLVQVFKPLQKRKKLKWLRPVFIISGLWLFSLLAGGQPSVLRSALMFTCLVLGEGLNKKSSIFNTLAFSAFILLCINPYWLWDVGFQLSYAAVLSIVIFMRPIYNWFYIKNKLVDFIWKLNSVTIAAQILTIPLSIYHFHQFPNYFLLTNFVAVPLSSIIVLGEILLCTVSWIPVVAILAGKILTWLIWLMNTWIERIEALPFSLWDGLQITIAQVIFLILFIAGTGFWLMERSKKSMLAGLVALLCFFIIRSISFIEANHQQKIIVYNVPQKKAIDLVDGKEYSFIGDSDLLENDFARNFHLKPARILFRISPSVDMNKFLYYDHYIRYKERIILLLDESTSFQNNESNPVIDLLVVSKNPRLYFPNLAAALNIKQVVFDGSVPAWKSNNWKKDCDSLHILYHDVNEKGAFVMNLN